MSQVPEALSKLLLVISVFKSYDAFIYDGLNYGNRFNTQHDENRQFPDKEAMSFFESAVQERLHISAEEFLRRRNEFKNNPHYETLMFMAPLAEHAED